MKRKTNLSRIRRRFVRLAVRSGIWSRIHRRQCWSPLNSKPHSVSTNARFDRRPSRILLKGISQIDHGFRIDVKHVEAVVVHATRARLDVGGIGFVGEESDADFAASL